MKKLINDIFHTDHYTLCELNKGVTNKNYLLSIDDESYVIRIPFDDSKALFNRTHEQSVLKQVEDLDVPTLYFDPKTGIKITKFIKNLKEYDECLDTNKIIRAATLIKKLHQKEPPSFHFHPIDTLMQYRNAIKKQLFPLERYDQIIDQVKQLNYKQVLCHNDIVNGNLLFGEERDYLIDYEYAATNDALFDIMSFLSENQITDEKERILFYNTYFDSYDQHVLTALKLWEAFHNILWCYWALMLFESRNEQIYFDIAQDKYNALKAMNLLVKP